MEIDTVVRLGQGISEVIFFQYISFTFSYNVAILLS